LTDEEAVGTSQGNVSRAIAVMVCLSGAGAWAESELGAQLPDGAHKVAEHRFKAPSDFEGTLKHYKSVYPATTYPRRNIVNQPGVKAVHIANTSGKGAWEGLNIYEANDEVRIYVVPGNGSGSSRKSKK
jgi:hypothetical protein